MKARQDNDAFVLDNVKECVWKFAQQHTMNLLMHYWEGERIPFYTC